MQSWLLIACVGLSKSELGADSGAELAEEGQQDSAELGLGPEGDSAPPALPGDDQDSGVSLPENLAPVANAGSDMELVAGDVATLDGSLSEDPDGDELTFQWELLELPTDSVTSLINDTRDQPQMYIDQPGTYRVQLTVDDGESSDQDEVMVIGMTPNGAPVAVAGPDQSVSEGDTVILDGTASYDPEGDVLNYQWTLLRLPAGSTATLSDPAAASPRLTADQAGQYEVELIVDDGVLTSSPDMLWITAESSGSSSSSSCSSCAEVVRREAAQHGSLRGVMTGPGLMLFPLLTLGWRRWRSSPEEPEDTL